MQLNSKTMKSSKNSLEINKLITIKIIPILIIIFLFFIILFSETKLTIIMATNLSNILLVVILTINQLFLYSLLNYNYNQYKICIILLSILITIMLLYTLYIKRIYDEELKIINQLKEKDIIADTNVAC